MAVQTNKNRIKSLFFILISIASFANANFGINNSNYQQKEVILTSITRNNVNIDVGGNTNLKGSLIAAGYINDEGNFIDNNQLSLTTDTLTYSSLSSTMFSNSKSESSGTTYSMTVNDAVNSAKDIYNSGSNFLDVFDDTNSKKSIYENYKTANEDFKKAKEETKEKIDESSLWNYSMSMGYSSEKTQATIGLGNIVIKDKENSDDIANINRDISNMNNLLYSGGIGLDVESVTEGAISKAIQGSVTNAFDIKDAIQSISDTSEILDIADNVLDIAINAIDTKNNAIIVYNGVSEIINPNKPEKDDENKKQAKEEQESTKEKTVLEKVETTIIGIGDIRDGIKGMDSSIDKMENIVSFQDIWKIENLDTIANFLGAIDKTENGLYGIGNIQSVSERYGIENFLDKIHGIENSLDFIITTDGIVKQTKEIYDALNKKK